MRRLLIILLLIPLAGFTQEFDFNGQCREAYSDIIMLEFEQALSVLTSEKEHNSDNACPILLDNYIDFLNIMFYGNTDLYNSLVNNRRTRIDILEKVSGNNPYKLWAQAVIDFQWSINNIKFKDFYSGALNLRRSFLLIEKNKLLYPDFELNYLVSGMLNACVGTVPPSYQWILKMASMNGSSESGLEQLTRFTAATHNDNQLQAFRIEALIYEMLANTMLAGNQQEGNRVAAQFRESDLESNLVLYALAIQQKDCHQYDKLQQTLEKRKTNKGVEIPILNYMEGNGRLNNGDFSAKQYYNRFLSYNILDYSADATRKLSWIAFLEGDTALWKRYNEQTIATPIGLVSSDDEAVKKARLNAVPQRELLLARILFDGANYNEALAALRSLDTTQITEKQLSEYRYRQARIYDGLGDSAKLIEGYKQVIELGKDKPYYYAANAALKLGEHYLNNGDPANAKLYFNMCLNMNPDEYKSSIHQKAKAHLNSLK